MQGLPALADWVAPRKTGGCRARALAYTGGITAADPGCKNNIHEWERLLDEQASTQSV